MDRWKTVLNTCFMLLNRAFAYSPYLLDFMHRILVCSFFRCSMQRRQGWHVWMWFWRSLFVFGQNCVARKRWFVFVISAWSFGLFGLLLFRCFGDRMIRFESWYNLNHRGKLLNALGFHAMAIGVVLRHRWWIYQSVQLSMLLLSLLLSNVESESAKFLGPSVDSGRYKHQNTMATASLFPFR